MSKFKHKWSGPLKFEVSFFGHFKPITAQFYLRNKKMSQVFMVSNEWVTTFLFM